MDAAIHRELAAGLRPRTVGGSRGLIVPIPPAVPGRKSTYRALLDKHGELTKSGKYFYEKLKEEPPNRNFDPNQQAVAAPRGKSETILLRDGSRATVRTYNHLKKNWKNTKLGDVFFNEKTDRWIIHIRIRVHHPHKDGTAFV